MLWIEILLIVAISQGILLVGTQALFHGRHQSHDITLFLLVFILILKLTGQFILFKGMINDHRYWYWLSTTSNLMIGPLVYYYIKFMVVPDHKFKWRHLIHFVPAVAFAIWLTVEFVISNNVPNLRVSMRDVELNISFIWGVLKIINLPIYIFFSLKTLRANRNRLKLVLSNLEKRTMKWLQYILWVMLLPLVNIIYITFHVMFVGGGLFMLNGFNATVQSIILIIISIGGYKQSEILTEPIVGAVKEDAKQKDTEIDEEHCRQIEQKLTKCIEQEKVYLDHNLSLPQLASTIGERVQIVSRYLNEIEKLSFYDYINLHRVNDACKSLKDKEVKTSILEIAFDSGFSSKSTFNAAFKKHKSLTPSQYRKKHITS